MREVSGSKKQPFAEGVIVILDRSLREVCTTLGTYVNLQFAVQLANLLAFDEEPLGIQHSNLYARERNTLFKFT